MPLSQLPKFQPNWITLSTNMLDVGANGVGGTAAGVCRFIAPIKCRVRMVAVAPYSAVSAANGIRVDCAAGIIGDDQDQRSMEIPVQAASHRGFVCTGLDDRNNLLEAGEMFRVKSDGASGASIRAAVTVALEPVGPIEFAGPLFAISGFFPNGTSVQNQNHPSLPGGYEILRTWAGIASTIAAQTQTLRVLKNGTAQIGAFVTLSAGGNDLTTFVDDVQHTDPDRFVSPADFLRVFTGSAAANFTTEIPYTILCRRLS